MVVKPSRKRATYQDVIDAPEHMVAEVLDGELHLFPRPRQRHARNATVLGSYLTATFELGINGPGGWTFIFEPELHLGPEVDPDIVVPDIAGWRAGRFVENQIAYITIVPDWACEVLSKSTSRVDRMKKMPIYAREGIGHVWLVNPEEQTIEVYRLSKANYVLVGTYGGDDAVTAEPFENVEIDPRFIWGRSPDPPPPADESTAKPKPKKRTRAPARRRR